MLRYILLSNRIQGEKEFKISDIVFCESVNTKINFWFYDKSCFTCTGRLSVYETLLEAYEFYRVQQSYLVNICHIEWLKRGEHIIIMKNYPSVIIRASRTYKQWKKLLATWDKRAMDLSH